MYTRRDGSDALNKGEREKTAKGEPLAGSQSRDRRSGTRDRRGAQAEQEVSQRFSPKHFKVNSKEQLELRHSVTAPHGAALALDGITEATTTLTKVPLNAPSTTTGTAVSVDTDSDEIVLGAGNAYLVTATHFFRNDDTGSARQAYLAIAASAASSASSDALAYTHTSIEASGRAFLDVSAVVDNRGGAIPAVQIRIAGSTTNIDGLRGWASAVKI